MRTNITRNDYFCYDF